MARNPIDIAVRISPDLSALIESRVNDPDIDEPPTLGGVRAFLAGLLPTAFNEAEAMHHFDVSESLMDELDAVIDEFGEGALAVDFVQSVGSEPLSRVIEAVVNDENRENPPTLATIRDAIVGGLGARLVGDGVLEDDEDDGLLAEIEGLIDRFGEDVLAENLLRYE